MKCQGAESFQVNLYYTHAVNVLQTFFFLFFFDFPFFPFTGVRSFILVNRLVLMQFVRDNCIGEKPTAVKKTYKLHTTSD